MNHSPLTVAQTAQTVTVDGIPILCELSTQINLTADPQGVGQYLHFTAAEAAARHVFTLGQLTHVRRFTCCHRYEPYWMTSEAGTRGGEVPIETQFLLVEADAGAHVLWIPLVDGAFRAAFQGHGEHGLDVVLESGGPAVTAAESTCVFVAAGADPFTLLEAAARSVAAWLGTGRLRREKALPAFVDQFGWCTWDAFYQEVTHDDVRTGLESFVDSDTPPRLLILDDGWQSTLPGGDRRLIAFAANGKFPGDLGPTVTMAKEEFGIRTFLVWHAMNGYWDGVDGDALPGYDVREQPRDFSPGIHHYYSDFNTLSGRTVGLVPPEQSYRFFQDYHRHLRQQGVDGVKTDNQAVLEGVAQGMGGRVTLMQRYHEALEGSVHTHFGGNLINCMSCSGEMLYAALNSTLTRTSTDFWPQRPASHGLHLYDNAQVGLWFGEFVHPDWDMFQSGHAMGAFHAAGRAVSGSPVYVSDKPDAHNFDVLRKLVLPDGSVLRAQEPGRPTRDCLYANPTREDVLLKIFNTNVGAGVIGVFNARYEPDQPDFALSGAVRPTDVEGLAGERFAVFAHNAQTVRVLEREAAWELTLPQLEYEVFTLAPIEDGVAPLGLVELFNSAGAIRSKGFRCPDRYEIAFKGVGRFVIWSERAPVAVELDGAPVAFTYDPAAHLIEITLEELVTGTLHCRF